tara:strand:- start:10788 stop:11726 length:939 start_codon:yes stop_codon:yes gene_type:complete
MSEEMNNQVSEAIVEDTVVEEATVAHESSNEGTVEQKDLLTEDTAEVVEEVKEDVNKEESEPVSWLDSLDEELKNSTFVEKFKGKSINDVIRSAINAEKLIGKKIEDFSKEDFDKFAVKTGRPEESTGYVMSDELTDQERYQSAFYDANLSKEQAKVLSDKLVEYQREIHESYQQQAKIAAEEAKQALMSEFGDAFESRLNIAKNTIKQYGGDELLQAINQSGLGNNPAVIKAFAKLGKDLGEDKIIGSDKRNVFGVTPSEAQEEISRLKKDTEFMNKYLAKGQYGKMSAEHKEAVKRMTDLFSKAYSENMG